MDKGKFRELSFAFASGILEGPEADSFLAALESADEEELIIYAEAVALAQDFSAAGRAPKMSDNLKARLMKRVRLPPAEEARTAAERIDPGPAPGPRPPARTGVVTAPESWISALIRIMRNLGKGGGLGIGFAVLGLGTGLLFHAFHLQGDLGRQQTSLEETRTRISRLEDSLSRKTAMLEVLLSHNLQMVVLRGQEKDPHGYGKMMWCPKRRCGILHVANIPPVPEGRTYQLWFLEAGTGAPMDGGVFRVDKTTWDGDLFRIEGMKEVDRARLKGFLVTLEPDGGSPAPSGDPFLSGSTI